MPCIAIVPARARICPLPRMPGIEIVYDRAHTGILLSCPLVHSELRHVLSPSQQHVYLLSLSLRLYLL
eukprot:411534-Hanusia_phi.AAC.1